MTCYHCETTQIARVTPVGVVQFSKHNLLQPVLHAQPKLRSAAQPGARDGYTHKCRALPAKNYIHPTSPPAYTQYIAYTVCTT